MNVKATGPTVTAWLITMTLAAGGMTTTAQTANRPAGTNAAPAPLPTAHVAVATPRQDEAAFRIISERNIFNANRSGGRVTVANTRRPTRIDHFTLVGTMAYAKGAFAFFEGSSSEFDKVAKANDVIAGHKLVDVLADGVMLEADGKQLELLIGWGMRREDAGVWQVVEVSSGGSNGGAGSGSALSRTSDSGSRSGHSSRGDYSGRSSRSPRSDPAPDQAAVDKQERKELKKESKLESKTEAEVLKRLMERREKE